MLILYINDVVGSPWLALKHFLKSHHMCRCFTQQSLNVHHLHNPTDRGSKLICSLWRKSVSKLLSSEPRDCGSPEKNGRFLPLSLIANVTLILQEWRRKMCGCIQSQRRVQHYVQFWHLHFVLATYALYVFISVLSVAYFKWVHCSL